MTKNNVAAITALAIVALTICFFRWTAVAYPSPDRDEAFYQVVCSLDVRVAIILDPEVPIEKGKAVSKACDKYNGETQ